MNNVELVKTDLDKLKKIWKLGFTEESPTWKQWDGPYFDDDYTQSNCFEQFLVNDAKFFLSDAVRCIVVNGEPIGTVSMYWEDKKTRWLNVGIIIFSDSKWSKGVGTIALKKWIGYIFNTIDDLEHIGLTTWSGNYRMMRVAEKLGMQKEAQIRKVRYHNEFYYDSVSYGILRDEWEQLIK